jgi:hypothetical protein
MMHNFFSHFNLSWVKFPVACCDDGELNPNPDKPELKTED